MGGDVRLDGFAVRVEQVLNLARLLTDGIERIVVLARLRRRAAGGERVWLANAVAGVSSHLCHCLYSALEGDEMVDVDEEFA